MSKTNKEMRASYLIERVDSNGLTSSRIIDCPDSIKQYRSEYLFLFHQLIRYSENPTNDPQVIFNLGNMARRFLEGYFSFKFLEHQNVDASLPKLIADPIMAERSRKFMHFYSHSLSRLGGMQFPDMSEAKSIIDTILEAVRNQDPTHYSALQSTL